MIISSRVVLPAPFGPTRAATAPAWHLERAVAQPPYLAVAPAEPVGPQCRDAAAGVVSRSSDPLFLHVLAGHGDQRRDRLIVEPGLFGGAQPFLQRGAQALLRLRQDRRWGGRDERALARPAAGAAPRARAAGRP